MDRDDNDSKQDGRWLALVPVGVAATLLLLIMPHATPPEAIPLPYVDDAANRRVLGEDEARAAAAREKRLPGDILAVGTAVRGMNFAQAHSTPETDISVPKKILDDSLRVLVERRDEAIADLLSLRALQLSAFVAEVRKFESTGESTRELEELGGAFVERMQNARWMDGTNLLLSPVQLAVSFKIVWNALTGLDALPQFKLTLDEERALFTLFLTRPHGGESTRYELEAARRGATDPKSCERANADEKRAAELWRVDKIKKLGAIDPDYPTAYALGVAYYRAGRLEQSVDAFRNWIDAHPNGPFALRAQNHLKAAIAAYGVD